MVSISLSIWIRDVLASIEEPGYCRPNCGFMDNETRFLLTIPCHDNLLVCSLVYFFCLVEHEYFPFFFVCALCFVQIASGGLTILQFFLP